MPRTEFEHVAGVDEYRRSLGEVLRAIRSEAETAPPVVFGNNHKPEAATISYARLRELERAEELVEDLALAYVLQTRREEPVVGTVADFFRAAGIEPSEYGVEDE